MANEFTKFITDAARAHGLRWDKTYSEAVGTGRKCKLWGVYAATAYESNVLAANRAEFVNTMREALGEQGEVVEHFRPADADIVTHYSTPDYSVSIYF